MSNVVKLNADNFNELVMENSQTVLVDFYADWCGPCKMLAPIIDEVANDLSGKAVVAKLNIDEARDIAIEYQVASIPTLMVFKGGAVVETMVGARPKADILRAVENHA